MKFIVILCIFSVILFIVTEYYRSKQNYRNTILGDIKKEHFENIKNKSMSIKDKFIKNHNIDINFIYTQKNIQKNKLNTIIPHIRYMEYLNKMNKPNLYARGYDTIEELLKKYDNYDNILEDITDDECNNIYLFLNNNLNKIKERSVKLYRYIIYWIKKIYIAKNKPWLEDNMPHTLNNIIVMPDNWFKTPHITTFIHELTHIHQRLIPGEFVEMYNNLNYIQINDIENIKGIKNYIELNRNNPDGIIPNWIWKNNIDNTYWWISSCFNTFTPNNLTDVNNIAIRLEKNIENNNKNNIFMNAKYFYCLNQTPLLLKNFDAFNNYFGYNINNYHPNELVAHFTEIYLNNILGDTMMHNNSQGFKQFKIDYEQLLYIY